MKIFFWTSLAFVVTGAVMLFIAAPVLKLY
jgi:hypothetical protein